MEWFIFISIYILLIIIVIWWIAARNNFVALRNKIEESYARMDVYLKKRYDLIPNLVETVKGYAAHESETLTKVIEARNMAISASPAEKSAAEGQLAGALKSLFALAESYPNLKADSQFLNLQSQLSSLENDIAEARNYYNAVVKQFNTSIELFPNSIVAGVMKLSKAPYFEITDESQRENVKVQF